MLTENEIIAMQRQVVEEKYKSIYSPATYIGKKRYVFTARELSEARITVHLPELFLDLPESIAKQKYPSENRPQIIISSSDISVNFAFTLLPEPTDDDEIIEVRNDALNAMKRLYPQNTYSDTGVDVTVCSRIYAWYEYSGPTLDSEMYALNAFMCIKDKLLHFLFNCPNEAHEQWKPVVLEVINSIVEDEKF